jgi:hypothetical protein
MIIVLKLLAIGISLVIIAILVRRARDNARRVSEGIEEYHKEKEANGPGNPYADLAQLLEERSIDKKDRGQ